MSLHREQYLAAVEKAGEYLEAHPWMEIACLVAVAFLLGRCTA